MTLNNFLDNSLNTYTEIEESNVGHNIAHLTGHKFWPSLDSSQCRRLDRLRFGFLKDSHYIGR